MAEERDHTYDVVVVGTGAAGLRRRDGRGRRRPDGAHAGEHRQVGRQHARCRAAACGCRTTR